MSNIVAELRTPCQWCGVTRCEACRRLDEQAADTIEILERLLYEARDIFKSLRGDDLSELGWKRYAKWLQEVDFQIISPPTPTPEDCEDD